MRFFQGLQPFRRGKTALRNGTGISPLCALAWTRQPSHAKLPHIWPRRGPAYYIKAESGVPNGSFSRTVRSAGAEAAHPAAVDAGDDADRLPQSARTVGRAVLQRTLHLGERRRRSAGHRQRPGAHPPCAGRQRQKLQDGDGAPDDPAPDPARRAAHRRRRRLEALAQGDGAGVHAAAHFRLRRIDAEADARPSPSATRTAASSTSPST